MCGITTDASIVLQSAQKAKMTLNGKTLTARILYPPAAAFAVSSAEQAAPQKTNTGVSRLEIKLSSQTGQVKVVMMLSPDWSGVESTFVPAVNQLSSW
jgi:hypothetical protein